MGGSRLNSARDQYRNRLGLTLQTEWHAMSQTLHPDVGARAILPGMLQKAFQRKRSWLGDLSVAGVGGKEVGTTCSVSAVTQKDTVDH